MMEEKRTVSHAGWNKINLATMDSDFNAIGNRIEELRGFFAFEYIHNGLLPIAGMMLNKANPGNELSRIEIESINQYEQKGYLAGRYRKYYSECWERFNKAKHASEIYPETRFIEHTIKSELEGLNQFRNYAFKILPPETASAFLSACEGYINFLSDELNKLNLETIIREMDEESLPESQRLQYLKNNLDYFKDANETDLQSYRAQSWIKRVSKEIERLEKTVPEVPKVPEVPEVSNHQEGYEHEETEAKYYTVAYILDCYAGGKKPANGKKILERIFAKNYLHNVEKPKPNTCYKLVSKYDNGRKFDWNVENSIIDELGENWKNKILSLSQNKDDLKRYLDTEYND